MEPITQYVVAVTGWELSWLFSIADPKREPGPYREHSSLTVRGAVHRPAPFRYPHAEIIVSGRVRLPEPGHGEHAQSLGSLDAREDTLHAYVTVPMDRLTLLAAVADRLRLVCLTATTLFRRHGQVHGIHVDTAFMPDDW
ncbi:hypothetical protein J2847_006693 [Azospirillum agricola]|uniref:hypothetical protein n=1 Tax=Azospirillum agricola TaxID=1720247 RepID=UPI001AE12E74|nr:hypothetical protein [Azospirillum agricola]MBP2233355.1 hypothetical protein [Azospirillum agricola]